MEQLCYCCGEKKATDVKRVRPWDRDNDDLPAGWVEIWCARCRTFYPKAAIEPDLTCIECGKMMADETHQFGHMRMRHKRRA